MTKTNETEIINKMETEMKRLGFRVSHSDILNNSISTFSVERTGRTQWDVPKCTISYSVSKNYFTVNNHLLALTLAFQRVQEPQKNSDIIFRKGLIYG